ncbi:MAG: sulfurtransferase [Formosimonas sp.]
MFTTLIQPHEVNVHNMLLIDVRHDLAEPDAGYAQYRAAHIAGAHFLHLDHDLSGPKTGRNGRHPLPDLHELAHKLRELGMSDTTQVVVYDAANSMMAARAWWLLRHLGHEAVAVLDGGFAAWQGVAGAVDDIVPSASSVGQLSLRPSLNRTVLADDLLAHLADGRYQIIDARAPERFRGEVEPLDAVAGHIPNASNQFFMHNLTDAARFKSPQALRELWQPLMTHAQVVNQCGSGVTACHNILAQHIAGFAHGALYAGSWSEWCSDPARPVAIGA